MGATLYSERNCHSNLWRHILIIEIHFGIVSITTWEKSSKNRRILKLEKLRSNLLAETQTNSFPSLIGRGFQSVERNRKPSWCIKSMNSLAPEYLQSLFAQCYSNCNLRNSEGKLRTNDFIIRSFYHKGAKFWTNLPNSLKTVGSVVQSKRNLRKVSNVSDFHTAIM